MKLCPEFVQLLLQAKLGDTSEPSAPISVEDISDVENDDFF